MPTPPKRAETLQKHLTPAQIEARAGAEAAAQTAAPLVKPKLMAGNAAAGRYWRQITRRMEGLELLDGLDSEMLGAYCVMLARAEQLNRVCAQVSKELERAGETGAVLEGLARLDGVVAKLHTLERNLLQYAERLGLTPNGRARLARKRAEAAVDPDGDLFGD